MFFPIRNWFPVTGSLQTETKLERIKNGKEAGVWVNYETGGVSKSEFKDSLTISVGLSFK